MDIEYDVTEKDRCWYKGICDNSRCDSFCIRHYKMSCLTKLALLEGKQKYPIQLKLDADGSDREEYLKLKEIQKDINNFVNNGKNLLIYSKYTGNGKTSWANKLLLSYLNSIWVSTELVCRALFISVPKLMNAMKENISKPNEYYQYVQENIIKADLVVFDELNYKEYTVFEHDYLLDVLSQRLALGKSNVYTTNYCLEDIEKRLGTRLASRVIGASINVEFKGKDKRSWGV